MFKNKYCFSTYKINIYSLNLQLDIYKKTHFFSGVFDQDLSLLPLLLLGRDHDFERSFLKRFGDMNLELSTDLPPGDFESLFLLPLFSSDLLRDFPDLERTGDLRLLK